MGCVLFCLFLVLEIRRNKRIFHTHARNTYNRCANKQQKSIIHNSILGMNNSILYGRSHAIAVANFNRIDGTERDFLVLLLLLFWLVSWIVSSSVECILTWNNYLPCRSMSEPCMALYWACAHTLFFLFIIILQHTLMIF